MPHFDRLPPGMLPRGLAEDAAAQYVGVSPNKFRAMVAEGMMPQPIQSNGRNIWDRTAIDIAFDALLRREPAA